jgi:hypothetical protein
VRISLPKVYLLKIKIQIAKQITMLSFKAFETLANLPNVSNAWQLNFNNRKLRLLFHP